ncbi:acylphosphatase [Salipaludibacillus sp. HK11]|uniref:acylphosphatase n=1 Tax=Salipaludibacillus sp. HK11 TaxID=3394320 RepID=UPI0039FDDDC4
MENTKVETEKVELLDNLSKDVVLDISGFKLCSYLVALEGWRRGLKLTWYKDETELCKLDRMNSSTQGKFFSLSSKNQEHYFFRSRGDEVSNRSVRICQNKEKTKATLNKKNVPIPIGEVFDTNNDEKILSYAKEVGFPIVAKPLKGSMGKGVYTNIQNEDELKEVLIDLKSLNNYPEYIIEKYYPGKEYRIYVVGNKVVGATNRIPANVIGDGEKTIKKLIEDKNEARKGNPYLAPKPIKVDYEVVSCMKRVGYDVNSVPKSGEQVFLREKSNLSSGGDPIEATDELSKDIRQMAVDALKALPSIPHAGVDIIVDPTSNDQGVVLEVNATAEIGFHLYPWSGKARDVPEAIISYYFPETEKVQKSSFYFDYHSVIEPLKSWASDEVTVARPPSSKIYGRKFVVSGKIQKVDYLAWIKRQALRKNLHGSARYVDGGEVEIRILSNNEKDVSEFIDTCYKGSKKSEVKKVNQYNIDLSESFKIGFTI